MIRCSLIAVGILLAFFSHVVRAEDAAVDFSEATLTGDWGGMRTTAGQRGFNWEGGLKVDALRNRGAQQNRARSVSHLDLKLKMDLDKAFGWEGGSAMINVISDAGRGLNAQDVVSHMGVTNLEVSAPTTTRIFHAWLQQSLLEDQLSILAGIYPVDSEFQVVESAGLFVKPEYGPTAEFALTRGPSIFNNAAFGVRTRLQSADETLYAQWALMDGVPNDPAHPKKTRIRFARGDGAFNMVEVGWQPEADNENFAGHAKLAAGWWAYTAKSDDQLDAANIDAGNSAGPARQYRQHGGYVLGERSVWHFDENRYATLFARYSWADGRSSPLRDTLSLGLHVKGPLAARADDLLGLAWSRAGTASKWRDAQAVGETATAQAESATELTYRYGVTPWFFIQPNYQYIRHPGGLNGVPASRILGARFEFVL